MSVSISVWKFMLERPMAMTPNKRRHHDCGGGECCELTLQPFGDGGGTVVWVASCRSISSVEANSRAEVCSDDERSKLFVLLLALLLEVCWRFIW